MMRSLTYLIFLVILYAVVGYDEGTALPSTLSPDEFKARDLYIFNIRSWDDIKNHNSKYPFINLKVDFITRVYFSSINVSDAMTQLTKVGRLLQLAYTGSKGFPCSPIILNILLNYQVFVTDSLSAFSNLVQHSIRSLKYYREAMKLAWNDKFDFALRTLKYSYGIADKMMAECDKILAGLDLLINQTTKAAVQAVNDEMANYQDQLIKANSETAATVQELLNAREVKNKLKASSKSLEVTAKLFWMQVKRMAEARRLGDLIELFGEMASVDQEEKMNFIHEIRESGFGWLGLAKVNREAGKAIQEVNRNVDGIVNHLLTKAQAKQLIETLGAQILQEIQAETDRISKSQASLPTTMSPPVVPTSGGLQTDRSPTEVNGPSGVGTPGYGAPGLK